MFNQLPSPSSLSKILPSFAAIASLGVTVAAQLPASAATLTPVNMEVTEQVSNPTSSAQTEPVIIANPFRRIRDAVQTIDQVNQIRLREERRQELEAARREAAEQRRLEAERQQRYFESLSPEAQQAYLAEKKQREIERRNLMLDLLGGFSNGVGAGTDQQDRTCSNGRAVPDGNGDVDYETLTPETARAYGLVCN